MRINKAEASGFCFFFAVDEAGNICINEEIQTCSTDSRATIQSIVTCPYGLVVILCQRMKFKLYKPSPAGEVAYDEVSPCYRNLDSFNGVEY